MHGTKNVRGYFSKYRCIFIFVLLSTINVCIWEYHTLMGFVAIQRLYKWEHGWESSSNEFFWVESGVSVLCDSAQISLVLFSSVKPLCKTSQVVSEPMVKKPTQTSAVRWMVVREGVLMVGNASAGGGVYQCGWRDSPLRGRLWF